MHYSLEIFRNQNLNYNWDTLYVGILTGFLKHSEVTKYAIDFMQQNPGVNNQHILELAWNLSEDEIKQHLIGVLETLGNGAFGEESDRWQFEKRKWRFTILKDVVANPDYRDSLYEKIEDVFYKFGCPNDMYELIREMSNLRFFNNKGTDTEEVIIEQMLSRFLISEEKVLFNK